MTNKAFIPYYELSEIKHVDVSTIPKLLASKGLEADEGLILPLLKGEVTERLKQGGIEYTQTI